MIPKSGNRFSDEIMRQEKTFTDALTERLAGFVRGIGIDVRAADLPDGTFLPGLDIRDGAILVDESKLAYPGDLLHEAGHLAVTDPAERNAPALTPTAGDEMATLAWSYCYGRTEDPCEFAAATALLAAERERAARLATHAVPLAEAARAFELAADKRSGAIKVTVVPSASPA